MRRAVLRETLLAATVDDSLRLCSELLERGNDGRPYDEALVALGLVLDGGDLPYEWLEELYAAARAAGLDAVARLFLSPQPLPSDTKRRKNAREDERPLTLGERKSLARGRKTEVLDRLLRDPDPAVVPILLGNPRMTEAKIVALAARRPTDARAQRTIAASERFGVRYAVKRALVLNPYTPTDVAVRLVPQLLRADLVAVAESKQMHEVVRQAAAERLANGF